jgi:hypothetical protein
VVAVLRLGHVAGPLEGERGLGHTGTTAEDNVLPAAEATAKALVEVVDRGGDQVRHAEPEIKYGFLEEMAEVDDGPGLGPALVRGLRLRALGDLSQRVGRLLGQLGRG